MNGFITHTDADGIISALIFKHYNQDCKFKGFYSTQIFNLTSELKKNDVAVDLDMNWMKCISHHVNPLDNIVAKNQKGMWKNPNKEYLNEFYNRYKEKCPFNTIILILKEYNVRIETLEQLALVMLADGFLYIVEKFKPNCLNWLERYDMLYLYDMYMKNKEQVDNIIFKDILPIFTDTKNLQDIKVDIRVGKIYNKEKLRSFNRYVINAFNLNVPEDLFEVDYKIYNKYTTGTVDIHNQKHLEEITKQLNNQNGKNQIIISSAMPYTGLLVYTCKELPQLCKGFTQ